MNILRLLILVYSSLLPQNAAQCFRHILELTHILNELNLYLVCPLFHTLLWGTVGSQIQPKPAFRELIVQRGWIWADGQLQKPCISSLLMFSYSIRVVQSRGGHLVCLPFLISPGLTLSRCSDWDELEKEPFIWLCVQTMLAQKEKQKEKN